MAFYVRMVDTFMSGWGPAQGRRAIYVVFCDTMEVAEAIEKAAQDRSEMKYITIGEGEPRAARSSDLHTYKHVTELGGPWYSYMDVETKARLQAGRPATVLED